MESKTVYLLRFDAKFSRVGSAREKMMDLSGVPIGIYSTKRKVLGAQKRHRQKVIKIIKGKIEQGRNGYGGCQIDTPFPCTVVVFTKKNNVGAYFQWFITEHTIDNPFV